MASEQRQWPKLWIRIPPDVKDWIEQEAERNFGSQNSEIVRSIRERMDRSTKTGLEGAGTPTKP